MRGGEAVQHALEDSERLRDGQRTATAEVLAQVHTVDVLHGQVAGLAVDALVEDPHQGRVRQPGGGPGLAAEPCDERGTRGTLGEVGMHDLESDLAVEPAVDRQVDGRHPAPSDPGDDFIAPVDEAAD